LFHLFHFVSLVSHPPETKHPDSPEPGRFVLSKPHDLAFLMIDDPAYFKIKYNPAAIADPMIGPATGIQA